MSMALSNTNPIGVKHLTLKDVNAQRLIPLLLMAVIISVTAIVSACTSQSSGESTEAQDTVTHPLPDTLRVGTLYSPTSYFIYRETEMGYDYDRIREFTAEKGIALKLEVLPSLASAIEKLDSGKIDMIAYEVPITSDYRNKVVHCGTQSITHQVLVQPKAKDGKRISDVTELVGREVWVEKDSKYHQRLINLDKEVGGGIIIRPIDRDTLITEDLIAMVSDGEIGLTVVDSDIAQINKTYYNDLDITLEISFEQLASWGVSPSMPWLADSINSWSDSNPTKQKQAVLLKRYFERSKSESQMSPVAFIFKNGQICPYDHLFKSAAKTIGWDWRLMAAQAYTESRFDSSVVSWAGARGIMQLMPSTARAYGLTPENITNNAANIAAAAKVIASLEKIFANKVKDPTERKKFIIAAYNSGAAHILDAIAIAKKCGFNPEVWDGNVADALALKSNPEYYNDPVCKYGYFKATQTRSYVVHVYDFYAQALEKVNQ